LAKHRVEWRTLVSRGVERSISAITILINRLLKSRDIGVVHSRVPKDQTL